MKYLAFFALFAVIFLIKAFSQVSQTSVTGRAMLWVDLGYSAIYSLALYAVGYAVVRFLRKP